MNHKVSLLLFIDLNVMKRCCENNLFYIAKISHTLLGHIKFDRWVYHLNIIKKKLRQTDEKWKEVSIYFIIINCILIFSMRILWQSESNFFHENFKKESESEVSDVYLSMSWDKSPRPKGCNGNYPGLWYIWYQLR